MFFPETSNVSLVAFYLDKPLPLKLLLIQLQKYLANIPLFQNKFYPYSLKQLHCTIIGCEGVVTESGIYNKWFKQKRNLTKYINIPSLLNYLTSKNLTLFPLTIQFGNYNPNHDYQFLSRNLHPYQRSFSLTFLDDNTLIPILIGWSVKENRITLELDKLRREMQRFNLLHKYYDTLESIDNDLYLKLGTIKGRFNPETITEIETEIRNILQQMPPTTITLGRENIAFVKYQNPSLPVETTNIIPLKEISEKKLIELYHSC